MSTTLTWLGHACFLVETNGTKILVDPFLTGNPLAAAKADDLSADFVLVSHGHGDHVGDTVSIAKRTGATVVSNFEIFGYMQSQGVENAHPMHIGGSRQFPWGRLKLTIAHHGSALPDGSYGGNPVGFLLTLEGKNVYHACDTGLFYDMKLIGEEGVEVAILPIGDNFTMGPADAVRAVKLLEPKIVIPIHYNTFDVITQDPQEFARSVETETAARCVVIQPGEGYAL